MSLRRIGLIGLAAAIASAAACSASNDGSVFEGGAGASDPGATVTTGGVGGDDSSGVGGNFDPTTVGSGGTTGAGSSCATPADVDDDGDGFTETAGDCNDCDPNVSPGSIEVVDFELDADGGVPEPADEDCDGAIDVLPDTCDTGLAVADFDPYSGAKAIDLCQHVDPNDAADKRWGVLDAKYVRANGAAGAAGLQVGLLDNFGPNVNPQGGDHLLAITSGYARRPADSGNCGQNSCSALGFGSAAGTAPAGFPQDVPSCAGSTNINDDVGLEVRIRSPKNATGYAFLFNFYSFEYPEWVCTSFNDQFIALATPAPVGAINGNISFDSQTNPVSVNIAFFDVCSGCALGTGELAGTGFDGAWFDDAGATSWLRTTAPVTGGDEVTIRFAIWDTGDTAYDSTALIDGFEWIANGGTVAIGTEPIPDPK